MVGNCLEIIYITSFTEIKMPTSGFLKKLELECSNEKEFGCSVNRPLQLHRKQPIIAVFVVMIFGKNDRSFLIKLLMIDID